MRTRLVLCAGLLLMASGIVRGAIPECPDSEPYAECAAGNPCEKADACGKDQWCLRSCGCQFKCLDNNIVTIAMMPGMDSVQGAGAEDPSSQHPPVVLTEGPHGGRTFGPISLPPKMQLPNVTALTAGVRESLTNAVREAVLRSMSVKPMKCPNGNPLVMCAQDSCKAKPCNSSQVCVPKCGSCTEHRCIDIALPIKAPRLPHLPQLPKPKIPKMSIPKPPCSNNEVMNLTATLKSLPNLLKEEDRLAITCTPCANGTVSKQPALTCTLCLPGTFADRSLSICRKCNPGYYSSSPGSHSCAPCPVNSMAPLPGAFACVPCPKGFSTSGKKAQSACGFDASYANLG